MNQLSKQPSQFHRGNTLILVVGVLVLLVLVATAFITRTQSGRSTVSAQRNAAEINDQARSIGRAVADEIAIALFPREYVATSNMPIGSANAGRRAPNSNARRYGHDPNNLYNFAPYEVVPWTNPPDPNSSFSNYGYGYLPALGPSNPLGGPSFGDSRWLRDTEPQRADFYTPGVNGIVPDGTPETFTHWRHLSNLSRSDNMWRVVKDISDVAGVGLVVNLDTPIEQWSDLKPLTSSGGLTTGSAGYPSLIEDGAEYQSNLWISWCNLENWSGAQYNQSLLPQNFLDLSDLDGDGYQNEIGERKQDAFYSGTERWYVEKSLTDTDGDGFTDAFWHLAPVAIGADMLQVVAVSITDNSALVNANVGTGFFSSDDGGGKATRGLTPADMALIGSNDPDVYTERVGFLDNPANLPGNHIEPWIEYDHTRYPPIVDWDNYSWNNNDESSFLDELGVEQGGGVSPEDANPVFVGDQNPTNDVTSRIGRLWYWQLAGKDPLNATYSFRPFTLADELELRSYEGNNNQYVTSRFEVALNDPNTQNPNWSALDFQFLRSSYFDAHEASELRDQLTNQQLVFDNRRKLTLFNGVRNDLLPPWLRWEERFWNRHDPTLLELPTGYDSFDIDIYFSKYGFEDGLAYFGATLPTKVGYEITRALTGGGGEVKGRWAVANWLESMRRKVDLREYYQDGNNSLDLNDGWWEEIDDGRLTLAERAPLQILLAMTDGQEVGMSTAFIDDPTNGSTQLNAKGPLGEYTSSAGEFPFNPTVQFNQGTFGVDYYNQTRLMAAGLASNLLAYRDDDSNWRQHSYTHFKASLDSEVTDNGLVEWAPRSALPLSAAIVPPILGRQGNGDLISQPVAVKDTPIQGPNQQAVQMLGLEAQPFILEAFIGHVHGAETKIEYGACCLDGYCDVISENTCVALNGDFQGVESVCEFVVCEFGACCLPEGGCIVTIEDNCVLYFGDEAVYLGDGTNCEDTPCEGSCCVLGRDLINGNESTCVEVSQYSCAQLDGVFDDYSTSCATTSCTLLGSCCLDSGTCLNVVSQGACDSLGGNYSFNQFCAVAPCLGACCVDYAICVEIGENGCSDLGGNYMGTGMSCAGTTCDLAGVCCVSGSTCQEVQSIDECVVLGGEFLAGENCQIDPCFGSCCLGEGVCEDVSVETCVALNGVYIQGMFCASNPCRGACCFSTGGCENLLNEMCDEFGGFFIGGGAFCESSPCVPLGACCLPDDPEDPDDGGCLDVMSEACVLLGGTYEGDGVLCGTVPCGSGSIRGACCLETGYCQNVVSEEVCDTLGGEYQGELVSCAENPCDPEWACCLDNATCIDEIEGNCDALGGVWQDGFNCSQSPCLGACCLPDDTCEDKSSTDCAAEGGTFNEFRMCDTSPCSNGACCIADTCDDLSQAECVDNGGTFIVGDCSTGDPCGLGDFGACCMEPLGCINVYQITCTEAGGNWAGGNCSSLSCNTGACCLENGESDHCIEVLNDAVCNNLGGLFYGGVSCSEKPCIGACCLWAGGCDVMSENSCEGLDDNGDAPGTFIGVGSVCTDVLCDPPGGSCCLESGTCVDIQSIPSFEEYCMLTLGGTWRPGELCESQECGGACCICPSECSYIPEDICLELGGAYQGDGILCAPNPCIAGGACCFGSGSCIEVVDEGCCDAIGGLFIKDAECIDEPCTANFIVDDRVDEFAQQYMWDDFQETVSVVQLVNPFDVEIDLNDYSIEWFGQEYVLSGLDLKLPPATYENPATLILYSMPQSIPTVPEIGDRDFEDDWLDFLDLDNLDHVSNTLIQEVPITAWGSSRKADYDNLTQGNQHGIALYKFDNGTAAGFTVERVLVDRIDPPNASEKFDKRVVTDLEAEWNILSDSLDDENVFRRYLDTGIEFQEGTETLLVQWDRVTRAWANDLPTEDGWHNDVIDAWEKNPRYVFSTRDFIRSDELRTVVSDPYTKANPMKYTSAFHWTKEYAPGSYPAQPGDPDDMNGDGNPDSGDPDLLPDSPDPWFTVEVWSPRAGEYRPPTDPLDPGSSPGEVQGGMRIRKPTYFDMNRTEDPLYGQPEPWSYPDKGWYGQTVDADGDKTSSDTPAFFDTDSDGVIGKSETDMPMSFPMQMLQKDGDFDQVGELLNVWLFGHMIEGAYDSTALNSYLNLPDSPLDGGSQLDAGTITTFSEFMYPSVNDWYAPWVASINNNKVVLDEKVNRLRFVPQGSGGQNSLPTPFMMDGRSGLDSNNNLASLYNPWPRQAIASRILDSFVCDGSGRPDLDGDGGLVTNPQDPNYGNLDPDDNLDFESDSYAFSFYNAHGYSGKTTPGLININTASVETLRTLPHMYKTVHPSGNSGNDQNPRSLIPESIIQWRDLANGGYNDLNWDAVLTDTGFTGGPNYSAGFNESNNYYSLRSATLGLTPGVGIKDTRGFSSPSEIGLLQQTALLDDVVEPWDIINLHQSIKDEDSWRIDFAALEPFSENVGSGTDWIGTGVGAPLSIDVNPREYYVEDPMIGDGVSGDSEEMNMLQAGISNLITTRSDMFTVHMRIRTFKKNPINGKWDATDLKYIVDDSRYVLLVDRSNVNTPADKPKILYFEKLPN